MRHLVPQMRKTGDSLSGKGHGLAQGHRASFMARPKVIHSFVHSFTHKNIHSALTIIAYMLGI